MLAKKEFNDIVDWTWYPVPDGSGLPPYDCSKCTGKDCSKEVCEIDHVEACTVHILCPYNDGSRACNKENQMAQSKFVGCMEWDHKSDPSANHTQECAHKAGISFPDYDQINMCTKNATLSASIMQYINTESDNHKVQYYPDIRFNGEEAQGDYSTVKGLESMICEAYKGPNNPCN